MGNQNPVGVFDSGVGGIGTLSALRRELPREDFLYFGDTLHAPYGTKPREEVMACVTRVMTHLLSNHVKAVVIACAEARRGLSGRPLHPFGAATSGEIPNWK